jgi:Fungal Zn(2)-Cys(6) binuclear cluster domain
MAPRLAHKKSRRGCQRCKARKVKCDEKHPVCTNCSRHGVACEYGDPFVRPSNGAENPPSLSHDRSPQSSSTNSPHGPDSPYTGLEDVDHAFTPDERRLLELRLLYHYATVVTSTFSFEPFRRVWNDDSVRLGFEHPFLLNAIFAISSLHIVCDLGERPRIYSNDERIQAAANAIDRPKFSLGNIDHAKAHRIYLNLAIRTQREAVSFLNPNNADAVFLASVLLSYQVLKLLPDSPQPNVYLPPTQWLRMSNAISTVVQAALPLAREGSVVDMIRTTQMEPDFRDLTALFNPQHRKPFEALLDWSSYPEPNLDLEGRSTYEQTLAYIGGVWQGILNKEAPNIVFRRLVSLGIFVPMQFATFLDQGRPRALAILAHHFAMAKAGEENWWLRGVADREVHGIRSTMPAEWQWAMEWPLSVLRQGISVG